MATTLTHRLCSMLLQQQQCKVSSVKLLKALSCSQKRGQFTAALIAENFMAQEQTPRVSRGCPFHRKKSPAIAPPQPAEITGGAPVRPYADIPAPKGLPIVGTMFDVISSGGANKIHEYCDRRHKELGPIYKEKLGSVEAVFVADSNLIQRVYQNEGKYPEHMVPEPWLIFNEMKNIKRGLFFMDGQHWNDRRKCLNKVFLRQSSGLNYTNVFNHIINDILQNWREKRDENGVLQNLERELYNWSIESLGTLIFGRRLGCLNESFHEFVHCVQQIFVESANMTVIPPQLASKLNLPVWRRFTKAAERALELAKTYVEENISHSMENKESDNEEQGGILNFLVKDGRIGTDEIVTIVSDLFLAAADTTSHATQWALYLLAKNPQSQQKLYEEMKTIVGNDKVIDEKQLSHMHFAKAVIKESLRLYPVAPFLTRKLPEDITLNNFNVPKNKLILMSLYTTGRDPKTFPEADQFKPERWLRSNKTREVISTHACLPFGLGTRSCIGRRIAEVQMQLLLLRIAQNFNIGLANEKEVQIKMRMITTPEEPILLKLNDRLT